MRTIRYHETGGPETLAIEAVDRPDPGCSDVLVEVRAASVNPVDVSFREGEYPTDLPATAGMDVAGVVAATGADVTAVEAGDRVCATGVGGAYADYALAPAGNVAVLPDAVSFAEGAAVGLAGVTAWQAVVHYGSPTPTETVLLHGGSGGVGHVGVQLAALAGAQVVATAGAEDRRERVRELGADAALDYDRDDLGTAVREVGTPDLVVDHRPETYFELDIDLLSAGGTLVLIEGEFPETGSAVRSRIKDLTIQAASGLNAADVGAVLGDLVGLVAAGRLTVEVARTYPLEEAAEAQRAVVEDRYVGKLVVDLEA